MKKRLLSLLLACLLLSTLPACSSAEAAAAASAAPQPATALPAGEAAAPAASPRASEGEAPAEDPAPVPPLAAVPTASPEQISAYLAGELTDAPWKADYTRLLTDEKALDEVLDGADAYRKRKFSYTENLPHLSAYSLLDINGDLVPELLLYYQDFNLVDVFSWLDGKPVFLAYDCFAGFVPENGAGLVHGHWHSGGGSWTNEFSLRPLFAGEASYVHFDYSLAGGERMYSFMDANGTSARGSSAEAAKRYEKLYSECVLPCVSLRQLAWYAPDNLTGLDSFLMARLLPRLDKLIGLSRYAEKDFLKSKGWEALAPGFDTRREAKAARLDLNNDGIGELLISDGERCFLFSYSPRADRMELLSLGPTDPAVSGTLLYNRGGDTWTVYYRSLLGIYSRTLKENEVKTLVSSGELKDVRWEAPESLAAKL